MALNTVTLTFTEEDAGTGAGTGQVTIAPTATVVAAGQTVVGQAPIVRSFSGGTLSVVLVACDNTGTTPAAGFWAYEITLPGGQPQLYLVNFANGATQRFDNLTPVIAQTTYGPAAAIGGGSGTVTSVSVATADGFAGTVANPSSTPAITIETTVTGLLKGNGTAVSAAAAGTDYLAPTGNGSGLTGLTESQITNLVADLAAKAALAGATFTGPVVPAVVALTDAATIAVNAALGNDFRVTLGGNRTMGAPSNPADGQDITFLLTQDATGSRTVTWNAVFDFGTAGAPTLSTTASKRDLVAFKYVAAATAWLYMGSSLGF